MPGLAVARLQWHGLQGIKAACEAAYLFNFMEQALPDAALRAGCILSHQAPGLLVLCDHLSRHATPSGCTSCTKSSLLAEEEPLMQLTLDRPVLLKKSRRSICVVLKTEGRAPDHIALALWPAVCAWAA